MRVNLERVEDTRYRKSDPPDTRSPLEMALAERERFLDANPHLRSYQAEIDDILDKSGGHQGRMAVLGTLMQAKLLEMHRQLYKATLILGEAAKAK